MKRLYPAKSRINFGSEGFSYANIDHVSRRQISPSRVTRTFLNDYLSETSSIRKVVERETSVVQRNCSRIV